jgi:transposase InsO family protein
MEAVRLIQQGKSYREVARHLGYSAGAIHRWVQKSKLMPHNRHTIPTESSAPGHHPNALTPGVVEAIIETRRRIKRCPEVVHQEMLEQGYSVSLSSVYRTLKRHHLLKERSHLKRRHDPTTRPEVVKPGDLVQIDTIHIGFPKHFYVYTLLDVYSRWAHASVSERITTHDTLRFMQDVKSCIPFGITMLQSDHGSEFSTYFTEQVKLKHRHSRVRRPNDNAHLERFNRTVQEECLDHVKEEPKAYQDALGEYLPYYNGKRKHLSLNFKSPLDCLQGAD